MEQSDDSLAELPADAKAFLGRIQDDLHSDENHVSIFANVVICVIVLISIYIIMNFLGSVGHILLASGGLLNTATGDFIFIIGAAITLITAIISGFSIFIIIKIRRYFIQSYRETKTTIRDGFKRALCESSTK